MKINGDKFFYALGCIALFPFILKEFIIEGVRWCLRKRLKSKETNNEHKE
tara:strand:+ start:409 stop:558 length:150 start_codon:yes stop_codon:yes gene_type:complete